MAPSVRCAAAIRSRTGSPGAPGSGVRAVRHGAARRPSFTTTRSTARSAMRRAVVSFPLCNVSASGTPSAAWSTISGPRRNRGVEPGLRRCTGTRPACTSTISPRSNCRASRDRLTSSRKRSTSASSSRKRSGGPP